MTLQDDVARWHQVAYAYADRFVILAKATEELGEVARAMIGHEEGRDGRGDVFEETVDVMVVLLALIGRYYSDRGDLLDAVTGRLDGLAGGGGVVA